MTVMYRVTAIYRAVIYGLIVLTEYTKAIVVANIIRTSMFVVLCFSALYAVT